MDLTQQANSEIFARMLKLISESNAYTYKILGYKYLQSRLILYFHDCAQVYDFTQFVDYEKKSFVVELKNKFYTEDYEYNKQSNKFTKEYEYEKPEIK